MAAGNGIVHSSSGFITPDYDCKRPGSGAGNGFPGIFGSYQALNFDSNRQTLSQNLNFSQETRPKTKFFSLLIYAGYPIA